MSAIGPCLCGDPACGRCFPQSRPRRPKPKTIWTPWPCGCRSYRTPLRGGRVYCALHRDMAMLVRKMAAYLDGAPLDANVLIHAARVTLMREMREVPRG